METYSIDITQKTVEITKGFVISVKDQNGTQTSYPLIKTSSVLLWVTKEGDAKILNYEYGTLNSPDVIMVFFQHRLVSGIPGTGVFVELDYMLTEPITYGSAYDAMHIIGSADIEDVGGDEKPLWHHTIPLELKDPNQNPYKVEMSLIENGSVFKFRTVKPHGHRIRVTAP